MEDDAPKSAVELAMARFKKQDADEGVRDRQLTDAQKRGWFTKLYERLRPF